MSLTERSSTESGSASVAGAYHRAVQHRRNPLYISIYICAAIKRAEQVSRDAEERILRGFSRDDEAVAHRLSTLSAKLAATAAWE